MCNTPRHTCSSCSDMSRYLVGHTPQAVWLVMWDVSRKNTRTQCTHFCVLMCGWGGVGGMFSSQLPCIFPFLILPPSPSCFLPSVSPLLSLCGRSGIWGQTQNHMTVSRSARAPETSTFTSEWKLFAPQLRRGYLRLSLASHCLQFSVLSGCCVMSVNFMGWLWSLHFCFPIPDSSLSPSSSTSSRRSGGSRRRRRKQYYSSLECRIGLNLEP